VDEDENDDENDKKHIAHIMIICGGDT